MLHKPAPPPPPPPPKLSIPGLKTCFTLRKTVPQGYLSQLTLAESNPNLLTLVVVILQFPRRVKSLGTAGDHHHRGTKASPYFTVYSSEKVRIVHTDLKSTCIPPFSFLLSSHGHCSATSASTYVLISNYFIKYHLPKLFFCLVDNTYYCLRSACTYLNRMAL